MGQVTQVKVDGDQRLRVTMARAQGEIANMAAPLGLAARRAATRAGQMAPKQSGRLARSVRAAFVTKDQAGITAGVPYAGVQEYGWAAHSIAASPYLRPGVADTAADTLDDLTGHARHALAQVEGA